MGIGYQDLPKTPHLKYIFWFFEIQCFSGKVDDFFRDSINFIFNLILFQTLKPVFRKGGNECSMKIRVDHPMSDISI